MTWTDDQRQQRLLLELWLREMVTVEIANKLEVPPCQLTDYASLREHVIAEILPRVTRVLGLGELEE